MLKGLHIYITPMKLIKTRTFGTGLIMVYKRHQKFKAKLEKNVTISLVSVMGELTELTGTNFCG